MPIVKLGNHYRIFTSLHMLGIWIIRTLDQHVQAHGYPWMIIWRMWKEAVQLYHFNKIVNCNRSHLSNTGNITYYIIYLAHIQQPTCSLWWEPPGLLASMLRWCCWCCHGCVSGRGWHYSHLHLPHSCWSSPQHSVCPAQMNCASHGHWFLA